MHRLGRRLSSNGGDRVLMVPLPERCAVQIQHRLRVLQVLQRTMLAANRHWTNRIKDQERTLRDVVRREKQMTALAKKVHKPKTCAPLQNTRSHKMEADHRTRMKTPSLRHPSTLPKTNDRHIRHLATPLPSKRAPLTSRTCLNNRGSAHASSEPLEVNTFSNFLATSYAQTRLCSPSLTREEWVPLATLEWEMKSAEERAQYRNMTC